MQKTVQQDGLLFVHFSDIHLQRSEIKSGYELDADIRHEVKNDLVRLLRGETIDGILVTGDIAFAGLPEEFESARKWLKDLCESLGCPPERVWVVPGNHDVDRAKARPGEVAETVRDSAREAACNGDFTKFRNLLVDPSAEKVLFGGLEAFNDFAKYYSCQTRRKSLTWDAEFRLNDGSTLRLVGLNSALLSDKFDSDGDHRLILSKHQVQLRRERGVVYVTMCHHPPSWLFDADTVEDHLNNRAVVQMYGHKHRQRIRFVDEGSVKLFSGALHPSRGETDWSPQYNVLSLRVEGTGEHRVLNVDVQERIWIVERTSFGSAPTSPRSYQIELDPWYEDADDGDATGVVSKVGDKTHAEAPNDAEVLPASEEESESSSVANSFRDLVYRFFSLPYPKRIEVLNSLDLLESSDAGQDEVAVTERAFERAKKRNQLQQLEDAVAERNTTNEQT